MSSHLDKTNLKPVFKPVMGLSLGHSIGSFFEENKIKISGIFDPVWGFFLWPHIRDFWEVIVYNFTVISLDPKLQNDPLNRISCAGCYIVP